MKDVKDSKLLRFLVPFGVVIATLCMLFSFRNTTDKSLDLVSIFSLTVQFVIGILITVFSIKTTHKATHLFLGLLLIFWGIFYVLVSYVFSVTIKECWPIYGIMTGILLFVSGFYKYEKMKFGYVIPAFTLFCMGLWYSFFSFKIIKKSFVTVASNLGPFFMLLIAVLLVIFFLLQQKHKELVLADDETGTFSDEDDEIMTQDE